MQNAVVFQAYGMASRRILGLTDDRTPPTYSQTFLAGAPTCLLHNHLGGTTVANMAVQRACTASNSCGSPPAKH